MTVSYTLDVSTSGSLGFLKVLFRWRASLWKSVFKDLLLWLFFYYLLSFLYRFVLEDWQREIFEDAVSFAYKYADFIPLTFMLGFYVTQVVNRWWDMFLNIGWVDSPSLFVSAYIEGTDEEGRMIRRNIVRYMILIQALIFRDISVTVRRRFPTLDSLEKAGLMSADEKKTLLDIDSPNPKYWAPIQWAYFLIRYARQQGRIKSDLSVNEMFKRLEDYRSCLGKLLCYDLVPIPLVYTQVVILTVRIYFIICLMGRQYVQTDRPILVNHTVDYYIPMMTMVQFIFYVGWLKVAEALLNPFGEDDDDFEVNWLLDRNLQVGLTIVDDSITKQPPLAKDFFWADSNPEPLYSTKAMATVRTPLVGSATEISLSKSDEKVVMVPHVRDDSMQTESEYTRGTSVTTASSETSSLKEIVRGKLTRLGSNISAHLQGKANTHNASIQLQPPIIEDGENMTKLDDLSCESNTTIVIDESTEQEADSVSSDSEPEEQITLTEERGTMTDGALRQTAASGKIRQFVQTEGESSKDRTRAKELPAVVEEDELCHHNEAFQ